MGRTVDTKGGLDLPPGFRAVVLREHRDAFAHAQEVAGEEGAGTLVWVRRFDIVEIAVVLEPEEPLKGARRAIFAVLNAAADAIAVHAPPEKPLTLAYPDTILLDGGIIGGARLTWPKGAREDAPPDWLVAGLQLRISVPHTRVTGSSHVLDLGVSRGTSLEIEGFEIMDATSLIESFARHLLLQVDRWHTQGFKAIGEQFLGRLLETMGARRGIDDNGDLLLRSRDRGRGGERLSLCAGLAEPQWLDKETGQPWL